MEFFNITEPHYTDALKTAVGCMVSIDSEDAEPVPFTACIDDVEDYGRMFYQDLIAGKYGDIQPYIEPPLTSGEAASIKSNKLNEATINISTLQDAVDLGMATDEELTQLKAWKTYRVLLSRVDTAFAPDIEWPVIPA
ncbi:tail fiber assembly protein [Obesumbacterium proteus]|uniref:tail fiber assembly protein n=1 Tax=Obesumbacterium proteus TaxID=82983 RepID=UPI003C6E9C88